MIASGNTDEELANTAFQGKEDDALSVKNDDRPIQSAQPSPSSSQSTLVPVVSQSSQSSSSFRFYGILSVISLISAIIAAAVSGVFTKGGTTSSHFDLYDPVHPRVNPHGGDAPYDFNTWYTQRSCKGLDLYIINNLDDKWEPYFKRSINDWENGDPDVLSLHVREPSFYDPECEPIHGVLKVCNGDYGPTDWIGVNHFVIQWKHIISSIAIMNDYHLDKMSDAAKQNTMCHELGHGFGLGHWDEDFYNRDLGNCIDYTATPENNQSPDRSNFLFLEQMYGNVEGTSNYSRIVNGTKGLHCTNSNADNSENFKKRKLVEKVELTDGEFSQYAKLLSSDPIPSMRNSELGERKLKRNQYEVFREQSFANGVKVVSTINLY